MPIAAFIIDVLCLRDRFSAVTIKKGNNSEFSTVDMCIGIITIIMLECERMRHIDTSFSVSYSGTAVRVETLLFCIYSISVHQEVRWLACEPVESC